MLLCCWCLTFQGRIYNQKSHFCYILFYLFIHKTMLETTKNGRKFDKERKSVSFVGTQKKGRMKVSSELQCFLKNLTRSFLPSLLLCTDKALFSFKFFVFHLFYLSGSVYNENLRESLKFRNFCFPY